MKTMNVPLLDLKGQLKDLREEYLEAITRVVDSTQYIMGPEVEALEQSVAKYCGTADAIGVSSGTDALLLALMALDVGPGDRVITTDFSFFATVGVIARLNATPVFVDIAPETYNLDPQHLKYRLDSMSEEERSSVKAILPVHLYGQCADMEAILAIAEHYGIPVVEDAAQAIGSEYTLKGEVRRAGNLGDMGCFSFFPSKNLGGIGDAGMVTVNDESLAHSLRLKRVHGGEPKYFHKVIGGNFRIDPIQAAVLSVKLPHLDGWHQARQENADYYNSLFEQKDLDQLVRPHAVYQAQGLKNYHIYNQYMIRVPKRDELRSFLQSHQIASEVYYPLTLHQQECFHYLGHSYTGAFPESEKAASEVLALPIYPDLTHAMLEHVVKHIAKFYNET